MFKELVKVFGETVIYGLTGVASTLASVFLVPFYTRVLSPEDYGISALIGTLFSILVVIANLGMNLAIFRSYFDAKEEDRGAVAGTSFISQTLIPLIVAVVSFLSAGFISRLLFGDEGSILLIELSALALFFNAGIFVPLALLRAEGKPVSFLAVNLVKLFFTIVLSVILVVVLRQGLLGVFWANLAGAAAGYFMGLAYLIKRIRFVFSRELFLEMLKFGGPLVPAGLALLILNSSDRYFLNHFVGTAEVGIYNAGYKVGTLVTLVSRALQLSYSRFIFSIYREKADAKFYFKKIATYFYLVVFITAMLISVFAKEAIQIITGSAFHSSYVVVPFISFSFVAYSLYQNFETGILISGKTYLSSLAVIAGSVFNLIANYFLIAKFGMIGAASSALISFILLAWIELRFSQRLYQISFEFKRMATISAVGGFLIYISTLINFGLVLSLLLKSFLVLSFPTILYVMKFFDARELKKLKVIWSAVKISRGRPKAFLDSLKQDFIS